jgi:hypothetical protein
LQIATIRVLTLVRRHRKETLRQITVRKVQLQPFKAGVQRALRSGAKSALTRAISSSDIACGTFGRCLP